MAEPERRFCVVLAEDSDDDYALFSAAFEEEGGGSAVLYRVKNGEALLQFLRRPAAFRAPEDRGLPALVLLDLRIPRKAGIVALAEIKSDPALSSTPVLVVSGYADPEVVARAYQAGANCFLRKPLRYEQLRRLVSALRDFWFDLAVWPEDAPERAGASGG